MAEPSRKRPKEAISDINSDHFYSSDSRSSLEEPDDDDSVLWPCHFSTLAKFKELTNNKVLKPTLSTDMFVNIIELSPELFPVKTCLVCKGMLQDSSLVKAVADVKWRLVHTRMYDLKEEDARVYQLITAVRTLLQHGCYNGMVKSLSMAMVSLLRTHAICPTHNLRLNVVCPSKCTEVGGIATKIGFKDEKSEDDYSYPIKKVRGVPDMSVVQEDEPYLFLAIGENKKRKKDSRLWRQVVAPEDDTDESEIGQLMLYMCASHIKRFSFTKRSAEVQPPILGLYMKNFKFQQVIADVTKRGDNQNLYDLSLYMSEPEDLATGMVTSLKLLHKFLSMNN